MVSRTALLLALAAAGQAFAAAAASTAPFPVPTVQVSGASAAAGFTLEGTLQPQLQISVAAQALGRVLVLAVKAGDRVKAGQLLARIGERELQAGVAVGDAGVSQAQAVLTQAEQNTARTRDLRSQGFLSAAALDSATAQLSAAQAALQQAQATRTQAALARTHATVTAPFDGLVLATQVDVGDLATPGRPLLTLYAPGRLRAVVQLPASLAVAARAATQVDVTLPGGQRVVPASRSELPGTDAVSQTIEWRLDLPGAAAAGLQPGQPVQVQFSGSSAHEPPGRSQGEYRSASARRLPDDPAAAGMVIPASAVLTRGELTAVYAVQGDRFVLKAVRLGAPQGDAVPVLAGLKAGERIAADPVRAGLTGAVPQPR